MSNFFQKHRTIGGEEVAKKKKPKTKPIITKDDTSDSKGKFTMVI